MLGEQPSQEYVDLTERIYDDLWRVVSKSEDDCLERGVHAQNYTNSALNAIAHLLAHSIYHACDAQLRLDLLDDIRAQVKSILESLDKIHKQKLNS